MSSQQPNDTGYSATPVDAHVWCFCCAYLCDRRFRGGSRVESCRLWCRSGNPRYKIQLALGKWRLRLPRILWRNQIENEKKMRLPNRCEQDKASSLFFEFFRRGFRVKTSHVRSDFEFLYFFPTAEGTANNEERKKNCETTASRIRFFEKMNRTGFCQKCYQRRARDSLK